MAENTVSASAKCPACGTKVTWLSNVTDQTILVCKKCGKNLGTYGDFKNQVITALRDRTRRSFKEGFKRR